MGWCGGGGEETIFENARSKDRDDDNTNDETR